MKRSFSKALLSARKQKGLSQQQLADQLFVNRSSIANWEADRRLPDVTMIAKIAKVLDVDLAKLLYNASEETTSAVVMLIDENKSFLTEGISIIEKAIPNATIVGFTKSSQAIEYALENPVALTFSEIKLGPTNGIDLCNTLLDINPHMNVIFLTAYPEYSIDAWNTEASGFVVKPITVKKVLEQLKKLRHPFPI